MTDLCYVTEVISEQQYSRVVISKRHSIFLEIFQVSTDDEVGK